jgi:hypothetical protein
MTIEIPEKLEIALKTKATLCGTSPALYVSEMLEHDLEGLLETKAPVMPYKSSYGILAKYGPAPTAEEIDENRKDMLRGSIFAEDAPGLQP